MSEGTSYQAPEIVIAEEDVEDLDEAAEVIPFTYEITAFGADYDVDGLVKRLNRGDIIVPTYDPEFVDAAAEVVGFQRRFVWTKPQADRFIESLLLGLPVPGIFLVRQSDNKLLVLDGQQRLRTLQDYRRGIFRGQEFRLDAVQDRFRGLRYEDLDDEDRRRIDDSIIHATVVRQDQPTEDQSSIYTIFERLNTGGTNLQPQEIRVALYRGKFADLLRQLNENEAWRAIYGKRSERLKDQELILRVFAMLFYGASYAKPMKGFLNRYMATNRDCAAQDPNTLQPLFESTVTLVRDAFGERPFRLAVNAALNAAVLDSVMTGIGRRLGTGVPITDVDQVRDAYEALLVDGEYRIAVERATADEESVRVRLQKATAVFDSVK